jgi:hypothetical protein
MFSRFCALYPDAAVEQEVRAHLANQLGLIAYRSATQNRLGSIRALVHACRVDAQIIGRGIDGDIPIVKYLALWLGGEFIRRAYRHIVFD